MTHQHSQAPIGIRLLTAATAVLAFMCIHTGIGQAEETAVVQETALTQLTEAAQDTAVNPQTDKKTRRETRRARREKFLENHPSLKQRLDKNQDGSVDKREYKKARQAWNKRHGRSHGSKRR